jgi:putative glutamine amidotransferase
VSTYRPLIGVVGYHLGADRVSRWPHGGYGVPGPYVEALRRADARALIVNPGEPAEPETILEPFDGLLLVGGGDVEPRRYGGEPGDTLYGVETDRDELEIELLRAADRLGVPTLCICRGMQVMNVAFGGTLHQHLPDLPGLIEHGVPVEDTATTHGVNPKAGTRLSATTKSNSLSCSSHHHQGVDELGDGLVATGHSRDGLVESIERGHNDPEDPKAPWMLGVQWHPEDTAAQDRAQQSLFDALSLLARIRGIRAKPGESAGRSRRYAIVEPDSAWPDRFDEEAARILAALPGDLVTRIDHIGSTSVPGLAAKPTIDIQLSLRSLIPRETYVDALIDLGYRWALDPWTDEHEYFQREENGERAFQIHACPAGSEWERRHLLFRDALRADRVLATGYERLKRNLAGAHPRDIMAYVDGKTAFIREVEQRDYEREAEPTANEPASDVVS